MSFFFMADLASDPEPRARPEDNWPAQRKPHGAKIPESRSARKCRNGTIPQNQRTRLQAREIARDAETGCLIEVAYEMRSIRLAHAQHFTQLPAHQAGQ
jgi:hypothetical protein